MEFCPGLEEYQGMSSQVLEGILWHSFICGDDDVTVAAQPCWQPGCRINTAVQ